MTTETRCSTFIDLGALARTTDLAPGPDPFGPGARMLPVRAGPCEIFLSCVKDAGECQENRGDCWLFACTGLLEIADDNRSAAIAQGTSAVIARGTTFRWRAPEGAIVIGMRYLQAAAGRPGIHTIDNNAPRKQSGTPADEVLLGERPACRSHNVFRSASGEFQCGTWDSTPYQRLPIYFEHSELMHLLAGEVTFVDENGARATFRKGDTYIIEQGASVSWESHEFVAKIYAQYRPAT
ncbi:cupin domain-containing protein [Novosphingobium resinovorum]|nr:cupin domain-containing protein [Novosphingobium resinovorum]